MKKKLFLIFFVLIMAGCTTSPSEDEINAISTSAAATVEARFTKEAFSTPMFVTVVPSDTPWPTLVAELPATQTPNPGVAPDGCLVASLVDETIPDGTVLATGEYFIKRWYVQNNGSCSWDQEYDLIYWDGDLMGGYIEYPFPDIALPGETLELPIQLQTPATPGTYTGYWMMRSRSGYLFGVGSLNVPISVSVDVRGEGDIGYGITSVEYYMVRDPETGCPANVERTIYAVVTVNGPMEIRYRFYQRESDGGVVPDRKKTLTFTEAGSQTVGTVWTLNHCTNAQPRYVRLVILDPDNDQPIYEYPEFEFVNDCPDVCN